MELEPSLAVATFEEAAYTFAEVRVASFVEAAACTFVEEMATFASMEVTACIGAAHLSLLEDQIVKVDSCTMEDLPLREFLNCRVAFSQIFIYYFDN